MSFSDIKEEAKKIAAEIGTIGGYNLLDYFTKYDDEKIINLIREKISPYYRAGFCNSIQELKDIVACYNGGTDYSSFLEEKHQQQVFDIVIKILKFIDAKK